MTDFLQLHLLTAFGPSNLNRDDTGRPKSVTDAPIEVERTDGAVGRFDDLLQHRPPRGARTAEVARDRRARHADRVGELARR